MAVALAVMVAVMLVKVQGLYELCYSCDDARPQQACHSTAVGWKVGQRCDEL